MGTIRVSTASWTDESLVGCGEFYPAEATTPEARLVHYASQFPMVEVDSSYYAMPSMRNSMLWVDRRALVRVSRPLSLSRRRTLEY